MGGQLSSNSVSALHPHYPLYFLCQEKEVICYHLHTLQALQRYKGHSQAVNNVQVFHNSVLTLSDNCLKQFDIKTGLLKRFYVQYRYSVLGTCTVMNWRSKRIVGNSHEYLIAATIGDEHHVSSVQWINVVTGEIVHTVPLGIKDEVHFLITNSQPNFHNKLTTLAGDTKWKALSNQDEFVIAATSLHVFIINLRSIGLPPAIVSHLDFDGDTDGTIQTMLLLDDNYLITGHNQGLVQLRPIGLLRTPAQRYSSIHSDHITCMVKAKTNPHQPQQEIIAMGSKDHKISIWILCLNEDHEKRILKEQSNHDSDSSSSSSQIPFRSSIVSSSADSAHQRYPKLVLYRMLEGHDGEISTLGFNESDYHDPVSIIPTDLELISTAKDRMVRVWQVQAGQSKQLIHAEENVSEILVRSFSTKQQFKLKSNQGIFEHLSSSTSSISSSSNRDAKNLVLFTRQANRIHIYSLRSEDEIVQPSGNFLQTFFVYYEISPPHHHRGPGPGPPDLSTNLVAIRTDFLTSYHTMLISLNSSRHQLSFLFTDAFFYPFGMWRNTEENKTILFKTRKKSDIEIAKYQQLHQTENPFDAVEAKSSLPPSTTPSSGNGHNILASNLIYNTGLIEGIDLTSGELVSTFSSPNQLSHFLFSSKWRRLYSRMYSNDDLTKQFLSQIYFQDLLPMGTTTTTSRLNHPIASKKEDIEMIPFQITPPQSATGGLTGTDSTAGRSSPIEFSRGVIQCGQDHITAYAMDEESDILITGSRDQQIKIWSLQTHACLYQFSQLTAPVSIIHVRTFEISDNYDKRYITIISVGMDNGKIAIFATSSAYKFVFLHVLHGHSKKINSIVTDEIPSSVSSRHIYPSIRHRELDVLYLILISGSDDNFVLQFQFNLTHAILSQQLSNNEPNLSSRGDLFSHSRYVGYESGVLCVKFSPTFHTIFSSSRDCNIYCHHLFDESGVEISHYQSLSMVQYLSFNGRWLWFGSETDVGGLDWKLMQLGIIRKRSIKYEDDQFEEGAEKAEEGKQKETKKKMESKLVPTNIDSSSGDALNFSTKLTLTEPIPLTERLKDFIDENEALIQFVNLFLMMIIGAIQLLSFGVPSAGSDGSSESTMINNGTTIFNTTTTTNGTPGLNVLRDWSSFISTTSYITLYILVVMLVFLFLIVFVSYERISWWLFLDGSKASKIKFIKFVLGLYVNWMSTGLFLPFLTIMIQIFNCRRESGSSHYYLITQPEFECFNDIHVFMMIISILFSLVYSFVSFRLIRIGCELDRLQIISITNPFIWSLDNTKDSYKHPLTPPPNVSVTALAIGPYLAKIMLNAMNIFESNTLIVSIYTVILGLIQCIIIFLLPHFISRQLNLFYRGIALGILWSYAEAVIVQFVPNRSLSMWNNVIYPILIILCLFSPITINSLVKVYKRRKITK